MVRQLGVWANGDPALLDEERVRSYFLYLKLERKWDSKSIRQARASLTAFFNEMLGRNWHVFSTIKTKDADHPVTIPNPVELCNANSASRCQNQAPTERAESERTPNQF